MIYINNIPQTDVYIHTTDINQELNILKAEKQALIAEKQTLESQLSTSNVLITKLEAEITVLKNRIAELEAGVVTPPPPPPLPPTSSNEVYFADDFENCTTSNLLGGWDKSKLPFVEDIYFNNSGGKTYAFQEKKLAQQQQGSAFCR